MFPSPRLQVSGMLQTELTENGNFMETASFRLFAANGNGKRKFVFLGRESMNGI
jgi:hypothetical protein